MCRILFCFFFCLPTDRAAYKRQNERTSTNIRAGAHHPTTLPIVFVATAYPNVCSFHSSCFAEAVDSYVSFSFSLPFFMLALFRTQKPQTRHRTRQHRCRLPIPAIKNLQRQRRAEPFGLPPGRAAGCIGRSGEWGIGSV